MPQTSNLQGFRETDFDPRDFQITDVWAHGIPEDALQAYKTLIDEGKITKRRVTLSRSSGRTVVEYYAALPEVWIHEELGRLRRAAPRRMPDIEQTKLL